MNSILGKLLTSSQEIMELLKNSINQKEKLLVTYFNQHCFNIYTTNKEYQYLLDNRFVVYADGFGINLASRFLFSRKYKLFNATDLNDEIISYLIKSKIRFYIVGGNFSDDIIKSKLKSVESFVGYSNGFFIESDLNAIAEKIKLSKANVIIFGMGVPKQEIISERLSKSINASLFLCVGNFLEFYFGTVKRVPYKYRNKGVEWLFRVFQEPKHLWNRYFIGIPLFIFRVIKFKFSN